MNFLENGTRTVYMGAHMGPHRVPLPITRGTTTPHPPLPGVVMTEHGMVPVATTGSPGSFWFQPLGHVTRSLC